MQGKKYFGFYRMLLGAPGSCVCTRWGAGMSIQFLVILVKFELEEKVYEEYTAPDNVLINSFKAKDTFFLGSA